MINSKISYHLFELITGVWSRRAEGGPAGGEGEEGVIGACRWRS